MKVQNSQKQRQKMVVVLGPTSSGKTALARALAQEFLGYIISADSRQVYRYMDIGTGKVDTKEDLIALQEQRKKFLGESGVDHPYFFDGIPHYLIDVVDPNEEYNVACFKRGVHVVLQKKEASGSPTFLVGGTGLYIDAVVDNWLLPPGAPDLALRKKIEDAIAQRGLAAVWNELIQKDPGSAAFVQKNNPRRVVRALEYVLSTGRKFSKERKRGKRLFDVLKIGIAIPRDELYKKIDSRVEARLKLGMIEEVEALHKEHGLSVERLHHFGLEYRVISDYLQGKFKTQEEMAQRLKWNIHAYARRQLTWFRRDKEIVWVKEYNEAQRLVRSFMDKIA